MHAGVGSGTVDMGQVCVMVSCMGLGIDSEGQKLVLGQDCCMVPALSTCWKTEFFVRGLQLYGGGF